MPEISRFFGVVIKMFFDDHAPPHFHAEYAESSAVIDIRTFAILHGDLPARALGLTVEWARAHQQELLEDWELSAMRRPLRRIPPL